MEILSPLGDPWRTPLEPPPTPSWPFAVLRGPSWKSFCLFVSFMDPFASFVDRPSWKSFLPLAILGTPSRSPSNPLVALCRSSWPFVEIFLPFRVLHGSLRVLRGPPFVEILSPLGDPWRTPVEPPPTPSWPFAVLRGPSWKSFCLFVSFMDPFASFVDRPSWKSFLPLATLGGPPLSPLHTFVALCRPSPPFVEILSPLGDPWHTLSIPLQPLRGPLPFFVALRGNLFAFPTPSWPFAVLRGPSWIAFPLFASLVALRLAHPLFVDKSLIPSWINLLSLLIKTAPSGCILN